MNPSVHLRSGPAPTDQDLAEQARPGCGIPSQDPRPEAQVPLEAEEAAREARSVLLGGGLVAGAATGAVIGTAIAGPAGVLVGGTLGAVAGAIGASAAVPPVNPENQDDSDMAPAAAVRLHVADSGGGGRPVVLIHGWPLSAQAWEPQVSVLRAAGYRVVAYDRRGFGRSDKPKSGYAYDVLADDLHRVLEQCGLQDVTLVGFSMGGGEVARYIARQGESRLRSVVFAAAVPPCLMKTAANPEGPLTPEKAQQMKQSLEQDRGSFFERFTTDFFSAHGALQVTESQRGDAVALCHQSAQNAALACIDSFGTTDFREDLKKVKLPTLVIHGDADAIVPVEGSGQRTHRAVLQSKMVTLRGAPHGLNTSHATAFNDALLSFLRE